ncbi:8496_t:CDS:1, partial [Gigaspora margarita]
ELINNKNKKGFIKNIVDENLKLNNLLEIYDDFIITTSSGLNIIKLTIILVIWHLFNEKNSKSHLEIFDELKLLMEDNFNYKLLNTKKLNSFIFK